MPGEAEPLGPRAAIEAGTYLPELFEPEAKIIRAAELYLAGKLKEYLDGLPKVTINEKKVPCSWRDMGRVLRSFTEGERNEQIQLVDGVKVNVDKGWVLVLAGQRFHGVPGHCPAALTRSTRRSLRTYTPAS